jgi:hypothetical protein
MSLSLRLFPTYPAKPAFGVNVAVQNAGDYLSQKKAKRSYCNISLCRQMNSVKSQSDLLTLKKSNYLYNKCNSQLFNTSNLNVNLYTKIDLKDVNVISNTSTSKTPTSIDVTNTNPSYITYTIDPCGTLFGNTICGVNNFQNYVVYNQPYGSINPGSNNNNKNYDNTFNCFSENENL